MTLRLLPAEYIRSCGAQEGIALYPVVQQPSLTTNKLEFPAVVYREIGREGEEAIDGNLTTACTFRLDARAKTYAGAEAVGSRLIECLIRGGRFNGILTRGDDYDGRLDIYRRIQTVSIEP